jgi:hypothetical protein
MLTLETCSVMWAGMGLATASGFASTATSWTRAKAYVKAANEEIFLPKGLRCKVLKTEKMMAAVGQKGIVLQLPPLDILDHRDAEIGGKDDPRMRRMRAMGDMVAPLTFQELPPPETLENFWKRMGSKQARRQDAKMQNKLMKERRKGLEDYEDEMGKAGEETRKGDKEIAKVEKERAKEIEKAERKLRKKAGDPEKKAKIEEDLQHELRKLDKDMNKALREKEKEVGKKTREGNKKAREANRKENKIAQKIYWIVITREDILAQKGEAEDDVEVDTEDDQNGRELTKAS